MSIKQLPNLIDAYAEVREKRLAMQRETDKLAAEESQYKSEIITSLQENSMSVAGSARYSVKLKTDDKPVASDWGVIYDYIKEHDAFDMLQRRLGERAIKDRWEDGIEIPGITTFPVDKLSISKLA